MGGELRSLLQPRTPPPRLKQDVESIMLLQPLLRVVVIIPSNSTSSFVPFGVVWLRWLRAKLTHDAGLRPFSRYYRPLPIRVCVCAVVRFVCVWYGTDRTARSRTIFPRDPRRRLIVVNLRRQLTFLHCVPSSLSEDCKLLN